MSIYHFYSSDYEQKTGGWIYNRHLIDWLDRHMGGVREITVPVCFPKPDAAVLGQIAALFDGVEPDAVLVMDHIYGCMLWPLLSVQPFRLVLIYHHSVVEERGSGGAHQSSIEQSALQRADAVVVTSDESRDYVTRQYGIAADRVITGRPGNDPVPQSPAHDAGPWRLLAVGAVIPRKRYEFLVEALAKLQRSDWSLTIAGNTDRYRDYVADLQNLVDARALSGHITLSGELSAPALDALWSRTHLYIASSFYEGYGMAISEAICRGVPVISTPSGAVASWAGDAALLVDADDPAAMTARIAAIMADPLAYEAARQRTARFASALPSWEEKMAQVGDGLRRLL
jgi:glycosyltransferase involved in cell wall biosynthesis